MKIMRNDHFRNNLLNIEKIMIDEMHEKALSVLTENIIYPEDFVDLYGTENVKKDIEYVKAMEDKFNKEASFENQNSKKLALVLEAVIYDQAERGDWLGQNAETIKTSQYDDIKNGVDQIVEFHEEENFSSSHLALAIDETFSLDIDEKFQRIKKEIENGKLAKVKYFVSEKMNIRGELTKIPRVIIGADAKTIKEIGELWLEKNQKELEKHPVQILILEEMILQIKAFKNYAQKIGQKDIILIYEKTENILEKIYKQKKLIGYQKLVENDGVYNAIMNNLKNFY